MDNPVAASVIEPVGALRACLRATFEEIPALRLRLLDGPRRTVVASWGGRGTWAAWVVAVAPDGYVWLLGAEIGMVSRFAAESAAIGQYEGFVAELHGGQEDAA